MFISPNAWSVTSLSNANSTAIIDKQFSSKEKKKIQRWNKRLQKKANNKTEKIRKNKFGRIGLLILLGGLITLFLTDIFLLLGFLGAMVFGIIGIIKDEKKLAAFLAVALPVAIIALAVIAVAISLGE